MEVPSNTDLLYKLQEGKCAWCKGDMLPTSAVKDPKTKRYDLGWTRDHVTPISKGGKNDHNVVLVHLKCNSRRGNREPTKAEIKFCKSLYRRLDAIRSS